MISPQNEYLYNIILSIFFGIVVVFIIDLFFDKPRIITLYKQPIKTNI